MAPACSGMVQILSFTILAPRSLLPLLLNDSQRSHPLEMHTLGLCTPVYRRLNGEARSRLSGCKNPFGKSFSIPATIPSLVLATSSSRFLQAVLPCSTCWASGPTPGATCRRPFLGRCITRLWFWVGISVAFVLWAFAWLGARLMAICSDLRPLDTISLPVGLELIKTQRAWVCRFAAVPPGAVGSCRLPSYVLIQTPLVLL